MRTMPFSPLSTNCETRYPDLLLILVPRKPERFDIVAAKLEAARIPYVRRSSLTGDERVALPGVLLLDTIGELSALFRAADGRLYGRNSRASRRTQHSGAGFLRNARDHWPAHGEFRGYRRRVPRR